MHRNTIEILSPIKQVFIKGNDSYQSFFSYLNSQKFSKSDFQNSIK